MASFIAFEIVMLFIAIGWYVFGILIGQKAAGIAAALFTVAAMIFIPGLLILFSWTETL